MTPVSQLEAILFAAGRSVPDDELLSLLPAGSDHIRLLADLNEQYQERGLQVVRAAGGWTLRTAPDASDLATAMIREPFRLTKAAFETLVVIAAFQTVTRTEIERVRGVQLSPGVMDQLLAADLIHPGPRRDTPGRPSTWSVTTKFYELFDITSMEDLVSFRKMRERGDLTLPAMKSTIVPGIPGEDAE